MEFFEKWVSQLEELLQQLVQVSKNNNNNNNMTVVDKSELQVLVAKVTSHVKAYYTAKWAAPHEDVLAFFSPVWLSPPKNAHQWVTGWKLEFSIILQYVKSTYNLYVNSTC